MGLSDFIFQKMLKVLESREHRGEIPSPQNIQPIIKEKGESATFAVFADPQVSNYMPARMCCFYAACKDIANQDTPLDGLMIVGDVTENGLRCELRMTRHILNGIAHRVQHFFLLTGNHDIRLRPYRLQMRRWNQSISNIEHGVPSQGNTYCHSYDFKDCRCIFLGSARPSFEGMILTDSQLRWLDTQLTQAEQENRFALVFNHQPLKNTNGLPAVWQSKDNRRGSVGWQSNKLKSVFENHRNVVFVTGHLHMGVWEKSFEDYGNYKCLSVPTVGAGNHGTFNPTSQGYVISVFQNKIVLRARLFAEGRFADSSLPNAYITIPFENNKSFISEK